MRYTARTDVGQRRENNEDNLYARVYNDSTAIFIVADGLGGYASGEVASKVVVNTARDFFESKMEEFSSFSDEDIESFLKQLIFISNEKVYSMQLSNPSYKGMGTTIVLVAKINGELYYVSVGDSRLYYIDKEEQVINQITIDDTYVNELLKKKLIKESEASTHPQKHVLTKALGIFNKVDVKVDKLIKQKGYLILCSDGLTNMLSDEDILQTVITQEFSVLADTFVDKANLNGGADNITVVVVEI